MRIAIVHHWFVTQGGGERVAEVLAGMFPEADIFTLIADPSSVPSGLAGRRLTCSMLQRIPWAKRIHRHLLPLYPFAVEQLDLTPYDLVLTSDSGPVKGVITRPGAVHICYCHSPMRYLWDGYHPYVEDMAWIARLPFMLSAHYLRSWDYIAAQRVTHFLSNSAYVAGRIRHYYGRESTVVYPPIDTGRGFIADTPAVHYLAAGRLVAYKKTEVIVEACNRLQRELHVVGAGPELGRLQSMAGPTIKFLGKLSDDELWQAYARCRALLFAADEDFGMIPLEAQACGRPVIAFGKGGSLETVTEREDGKEPGTGTGIFFAEQSADSLMEAILRFEAREREFVPALIQLRARLFDTPRFIDCIRAIVDQALAGEL